MKKKEKPLVKIVLVTLAMLFLNSCGKKTYEDCVLENAKELKNKEAIELIADACMEKYEFANSKTQKKCETRGLADNELQLLEGNGEVFNGVFRGTIYNGNKDIVVSEVEIGITYQSASEKKADIVDPFYKFDELAYKKFDAVTKINPNSAEDIYVKVLPKENSSDRTNWRIFSAKACK